MFLPSRFLLALTLLASTPAFAQVPGTPDDTIAELSAVRRVLAEFEDAWRRGDASALVRLWTEESDLGLLGSPRTRGRAEHGRAFADAFSRRVGEIERRMEITAVRLLLPNVAIADGVFRYGSGQTVGGAAIPARREPFFAVLLRGTSGWSLVAGRSGPAVSDTMDDT